jgi:hypothetical protein
MSLEVGRGDLLAYLDTLVHSFGSLAHGRGIAWLRGAPGPGLGVLRPRQGGKNPVQPAFQRL